MFLNLFANNSNISKIFATLFIIVISFIIIMLIGTIIAIPIFDLSIESLINPDLENRKNINFLKFLQAIQSIGLFVLPPIVLAFLFSTNPKEYLKLNKMPFLISALSVSFIMFLSIPFINYLAEINSKMILPESFSALENFMQNMESEAEKITEAFLKITSTSGLLVNLIVIALIPAIGEELLFRGIFQKLFSDWTKNIHLGVWIAAFLFSSMHMQFYGFLPRLVMGAMLGYMLVFSKNLWLPIIAHFVNNAVAVTAYFLSNKSVIDDTTETIGTGQNSTGSLAISLLFVISLTYIFYRYEKEKSISINTTLE